MKPSNQTLSSWLLALSAGAVLSTTLSVQAVEYTWDSAATVGIQTGTGNWSTGGTNWTTDVGVTRIGWPNTSTDSALFAGPIAADITISLNSTDIQLNDLTSNLTSNFLFLNQVTSATLVRTLTLTGGTYDGTGTTGSQFNIAGGSVSFAGTVGTTRFLVTGNSDIVKLGAGNLFFSAGSLNNTFVGNIYIKQGNLLVNNTADDTSLGDSANDIYIDGGTLASNGTVDSTLTLGSGRTITLGAGNGSMTCNNVNFTVQGQITGVGSLTKTGSKTLTLNAASNYSGTTTLSAGTLRLGVNGTIPSSGNLILNGSGFFNIRNTANWVYNGTISGDGTAAITPNTGTNATLAGPISGVASISASTAGTNATISGNISGANTVSVTNAGARLRLSGTNTYSGATTVNSGGTLFVNGDNSGATGTVTAAVGGTLGGSGTISSATTINGTHAPGGDISGVQTFTAGIDYAAASILALNIGTNSAATGLRGTYPLGYGGANVTAGTVNIDPAATGGVALNSATGDLNLSNAFWNSPQQWMVLDVNGTATAADTNALASTSVTLNGSAFNTAAYGTFSYYRAAGSTAQNSVWLQWTPATPPTWTGAGDTSWGTGGNWTPTAPATGDIVRFHTSSTSNLATVLGANYDLLGLAVISPSGPVSIGGANTLTLGTGGIDLAFATQDLTVSAPVVLSAAQSWTAASGRTLSVNSGLSGAFALTVAGAGTVSIGAAIDPLVAMTVASGSTLKMGVSSVLSSAATAVNLVLNGKLDLNGTSQSINAVTGSGIIDNTAAGASALTVGNNDAAVTLNATVQNTNGTLALTKTGTGALTINTANTFSGGFTNNGTGNVTPAHDNAFGTGPVVSNAGTIYPNSKRTFTNSLTLNGSTLRIGGGNSNFVNWNGPVTATGTSGLSADGGTTGVTLGSTLDIAGASFSSFANGTTNTITGNISGAGGSMTVTSGTLQLSGTNTYTGTTTLNQAVGTGPVLRLLSTGTISNSSNVVINTVGNFNVRNTVGWVYTGAITGDGTGSVNLNTGTNATLAGNISGVTGVNANSVGTNATVSGAISGALGASVQGGAILTLSGNNSTMSGTVTLTGDTAATQLNLKSATALGTGTLSIGGGSNGNIDNTSGAALTLSTNNAQTWNSDFTFVGTADLNLGTGAVTMGGNRGVTVTANTLTVGGSISGATFGLTKAGAGTLALSGANTYTGATTVSAGTLDLVGGSQTSAITVGATASLGFTLGSSITSTDSVNLTVGSVKITGTPTLPSYLLMTASSITGTPTLFAAIPGYELVKANLDTELRLNATGPVTGYAAWQAANGGPSTGGLAADHDNDGVDNGTEYFLGGNTSTTGFTALPGVTNTGGTLSVTWTKAATGYAGTYPTDFVVQTSATLADPWTAAALGGAPNQVVISGNNVTYTFPAGTKNFARLKVTGP